MRTAIVFHRDCLKHRTGHGHPERPLRLQAVLERLTSSAVSASMTRLEAAPAPVEAIARVHTLSHIHAIEALSAEGGMFRIDDETAGCPYTYLAARLAAGAVLTAIDAVLEQRVENAFCAVRPPGHHAETDRAMGFCFFNNVAIGARYAQERHRLTRIAIVDWDIHHGNGTQSIFYRDPSVFYISIHQYPLFPGTGRRHETGADSGRGFNLNIPVAAGVTDHDYRTIFREQIRPELVRFAPELILISAGFDGHVSDPLGGGQLTARGYREMTDCLVNVAAKLGHNRIISVLEGGYDLSGLPDCVEAHVAGLSASIREDQVRSPASA